MYQARILDKNRKLKAVLPGVRWRSSRLINEAGKIEVHIPRETVEERITQAHALYGFFSPDQPFAVQGKEISQKASKTQYAEIASFIQIVKGDRVKATGKIVGRDPLVVTIHATTEEILMESNITPAQYGAVWEGWDLADLARDLFDGWQGVRVKSIEQWQDKLVAQSNIDLTSDKIMLTKSGGRYQESGYITLKFSDTEIKDFKHWDRFRWSADSDGMDNPERVVWTSIQVSTDGTNFSAPFDGGLPDQIGYGLSGTGDRWVRINLHTNDTESPDLNDNPTGYSPVVFACEIIGRTYRYDLEIGNIPQSTGVLVTGLSADRATALGVIAQACDQTNWEFSVDDGYLNLAENIGVDRTSMFIFRQGTNTTIENLSDTDNDLVNVLTACGDGDGINRLEVTLKDEDSIAEYGEYPNKELVEFATDDLAELTQKAQEYLDEHKQPSIEFNISVNFEPDKEPDFALGDKVQVVDPDTGIISTTRIIVEEREYSEQGININLELGKSTFTITKALGRDGKDGRDGERGRPGRPGEDGQNGKDGEPGEDFIPPPPGTPTWRGYDLGDLLVLSWFKAEHASGYEIREDLNWGSADGLVFSGYAHSYSFIPTDREMILYIKALNVAGECSEDYDALNVSLPAPEAPDQPSIVEFFNAVKIRTTPLNNPAIQGYYVYITGDTIDDTESIQAGSSLTYPLESGTTVTIQVSAYDILGEGSKSEPIQATTTALSDSDVPDELIDRSKLSTSLTDEIDLAGTNASGALTQVGALDTYIGDFENGVNIRFTNVEQDLDSIVSTVGDNESGLVSQVSQLANQYTVKIDNNGHVAGYGLYNEAGTSEFAVAADKFSVATPTGTNNVFTVTDGKAYLIGDLIAEGSILADHLEADIMKTLLLQAKLAIIDDADILKIDAQRIFVGDNIELGDNRIVVKGHPIVTQKINITEDTYIDGEGGATLDTNYSTSQWLSVQDGVPQEVLLKIDVPQNQITSAKLFLYGGTDPDYDTTLRLKVITSSWFYSSVTWRNRPTYGKTITTKMSPASSDYRWFEFDITEYIDDIREHGVALTTSEDSSFYSSRHTVPNLRPYVVFEVYSDDLTTKTALGYLAGLPWLGSPLPSDTVGSYMVDGYYSGQFAVSDGQQPILAVGRDEGGGRLSFYDSDGIENLCIRSDVYPMPYSGTYFEKSSIQLGGVNSDGNPAAEMYVSRLANGTLRGIGLDLANSDVEYMRVDPESIGFYNDSDKTGDLSYQARLGAWQGFSVNTNGWNYSRSANIGPHDAKFRMPVTFYDGVSGIADIRSGTFIVNGVSGRLIPLGVNAKMVIVKRVGLYTWYFVGEYFSRGSSLRISSGSNNLTDDNVYLIGANMRLGPGSLAGMNQSGETYHYYAFG